MACKYSLLIPVYQVREYIEQCLDSIFCQIPADVQVILVDDGSTDGSGEICEEYAKKYPQIEVIHQENKGVAAARNAGLDAAKGEYLLWVDPDDWVELGWFSAINYEICKNGPDILIFDYAEYRSNVFVCKRYGRTEDVIDPERFLEDIVRDTRIRSCLWNKVILRSLFDGIEFDEKLRCLEDYDLLHHLVLRSKRIQYLEKSLYFYRIRNDGLIKTRNLDVSFMSYQVALKRMREIKAAGHECSSLGIVLQAKEFCRNYIMVGLPASHFTYYRECRKVLRLNVQRMFWDRELPCTTRLSTCVLCIPWLDTVFVRIVNRKRT